MHPLNSCNILFLKSKHTEYEHHQVNNKV